MGNAKFKNSVNGVSYPKITTKPGRVSLQPEEFEKLLLSQGIHVKITPTMLCPNRDEVDSTNHSLDCEVCHGDEVVELKDKAFTTWAFLQGVTLERQYDSAGLFDFKDLKMTTKADCRVYYMYKVEVTDFPATFNQVIERAKYSGKRVNSDKLRFQPVEDSATPTMVIDANGVEYKEDKDFEIDHDNKEIRWRSKRPANGVIYSVLYPALPTFRVIELMHESRWYYEDFKRSDKVPVNLPQQSLIRWDYIQAGSGNRVERQE